MEHKSAQELAAEVNGLFNEKFATLGNRMLELEQKGARPNGEIEAPSMGRTVSTSDEFKALANRRYSGSARIEVKAITNASAGMAGVTYSADPVIMARRQTRVRDLLTVLPTRDLQVQWPRQIRRTNAAAPVAETLQKPYSDYGYQIETVTMRTIAHLAKLTRQAADDAPLLESMIDGEMRYGLQLAEDAQLLYGDGTGENLSGLVPNATAYALPTGYTLPTNPTYVDKLGAAILQQSLTNYPADGIVLNPIDWMTMRTLKDSTGAYLFGPPGAQVTPNLFGLPIATTQAMVQGTYLLGAFQPQYLWERMVIEVLISSENANDFELNLLTMRAEERIGLAVRYGGALIKGSF